MPRNRNRPSRGERKKARGERIRIGDPLLDDLRLECLGEEVELIDGGTVVLNAVEDLHVLSFDDGTTVRFFTGGGFSIKQFAWPGEKPVRELRDYVQPKKPKRWIKISSARRCNNISYALQH